MGNYSFVLFSGGFDSTYALWKELEETDNEVVVMRLSFLDRKKELMEKEATENIMQWFADNMRPIKTCYVASSWVPNGQHLLPDLLMLPSYAAGFIKRYTGSIKVIVGLAQEEVAAYSETNSDIRILQFKQLLKIHMAPFEKVFVSIELDADMSTADRLSRMPKELSDLTWSCGFPKADKTPCNECSACDKMNNARKALKDDNVAY